MKFIPQAISRKVARQALVTSKHSPTLLFGAGVVGMVGSTVLACRATLKMDDVLARTQHDLRTATDVYDTVSSRNEEQYSKADFRKDTAIIYFRGVRDVAKLYAPSVLLGAASIGALTKSHNILQERNLALTAAYAALDEGFKTYRARVVERYGEDVDREIRYSAEEVDVIDEETGKVVTTMRVGPDGESVYARYYDSETTRKWDPDPDINLLTIRTQQNWANDLLNMRGHVFLNEVFTMLGLSHTEAGSVVGWIKNYDGKQTGDNFIDFGVWDYENNAPFDFFNGREGAILLDFNVDGVIMDKIESKDRSGLFSWN